MPEETADFEFSHVGICVADLARSRRFYEEGLGFQVGAEVKVEDRYENLLGVDPGLSMQCQFMRLGSSVIELIQFRSPAAVRATERPWQMNRTGLTHLSFRVDNVDEKAAKLERLGGSIVHSTKTFDDVYGGNLLFCLDPDGNRIELMDYPDEIRFA